MNERPDGGFTMLNIPVGLLIARAYSVAPIDMVGLPEWAKSERYDLSATSSLSRPTPDERAAMVRAMLADRFHLAVHVEKREQSVYDLVLARSDGKLGPGIKPLDIDCDARLAAERGAAEAARNAGTSPPASTPGLQSPSAAVHVTYSPPRVPRPLRRSARTAGGSAGGGHNDGQPGTDASPARTP